PASTPPLLLRRPPPARGREPCPAAAARRVQKNDGPTPSCARRIASFGSGRFPERLRAVLSPARPRPGLRPAVSAPSEGHGDRSPHGAPQLRRVSVGLRLNL